MVLQTQIFFLINHLSQTGRKIGVCRTTFLQPEKRWIYGINYLFFWSTTFLEPDFSNQISRTTFLEPLFYTFLEKWLQIKWSNMILPFFHSRDGRLWHSVRRQNVVHKMMGRILFHFFQNTKKTDAVLDNAYPRTSKTIFYLI